MGSGWGAGAKTLRTASLSLVYSTAENCAPVWYRSAQTRLIDSALNDTLRIVTGCLRLRQRTTCQSFQASSQLSFAAWERHFPWPSAAPGPNHILHGQLVGLPDVPRERLKSRRPSMPAAQKLLNDLTITGIRAAQWKNYRSTYPALHQSTAVSTWWCGPRPRLGWVEMAVGLPKGPSYPGHSPFIFSLCCPLNDRRRAAHSIFKIGRLFSLFLLSCLTLALLRLLILLLLLISGNVHPNPGPIFPCSVCAGNVTWRGKSVQCCACSKWVHLRCSQLSLSNFRALGSSHSWSCPPAVTL